QFVVLYFVFIQHLLISCHFQGRLGAFTERLVYWNLITPLCLGITLLTVLTGVKYLVDNFSHVRLLVGGIYRIFVPSDV
ncbi:MAG TPA: hypothetical protein VGB38_09645, partial [bacterium]